MMLVVGMQVLVLHRFVPVFMFVTFGQMKPDSDRHEHASGDETKREPVAQKENRDGGTDERRGGKVSARTRRADVPESEHEKRQAHTVTKEAHHAGHRQRGQGR